MLAELLSPRYLLASPSLVLDDNYVPTPDILMWILGLNIKSAFFKGKYSVDWAIGKWMELSKLIGVTEKNAVSLTYCILIQQETASPSCK